MVMTDGLFMEVVFIIIQRRSNSGDPVLEDMLPPRPLNLVRKRQNAIKKIHPLKGSIGDWATMELLFFHLLIEAFSLMPGAKARCGKAESAC
jgi:hypothetical protein